MREKEKERQRKEMEEEESRYSGLWFRGPSQNTGPLYSHKDKHIQTGFLTNTEGGTLIVILLIVMTRTDNASHT